MGKAFIPALCEASGIVVRLIGATEVIKAARFANAKAGLTSAETDEVEAWRTLQAAVQKLDLEERRVIVAVRPVDMDGGYIVGRPVTSFLLRVNDLAGHYDCFDCVTVRTSSHELGSLATWRKYVTRGHPFDKEVVEADFEGKRIGALEFVTFLPFPTVADRAFRRNEDLRKLVDGATWAAKYVLGHYEVKEIVSTAVACTVGASARSRYEGDEQ